MLVAGSVAAVVAQAQMGTSWRAGIDVSGHDRLVEHGLFRLVRNPFYLAMMTATVGVAAMTPNWLALVGWAALVAGCEVDVRWVEEPALQAAHGDAYRSYTAVTPRFVPNPFRRVERRGRELLAAKATPRSRSLPRARSGRMDRDE